MSATETVQTPAERLRAAIDALGITMRAEFVPWSKSRNAKPRNGAKEAWRSLNWRVTLERAGRAFLETDYSAGEGNAPSFNAKPPHHWRGTPAGWKRDALAFELEEGHVAKPQFGGRFTKGAPILPDIDAVVWSLIQDASVIDFASFEVWAEEYGYDSDSRTAETLYRDCLEIALKMRGAIGEAGIEALRAASEDY